MATSVENRDDNKAPVELSAPEGWKKTLAPKKSGTPRRNSVIFISPTGEEIKSKRQLDQYLKNHPGGPSSSEFDWGTGETPRRSSRLSEKSKATESPESEPPKKRQSKSGSEKVEGEGDADAEEEAVEEKDDGGETVTTKDVEMKEVEDAVTAVPGDKDTDKEPKTEGKDVKGHEVNVGRTEDHGTDDKTNTEKDEEAAINSRTASLGNMEVAEKQKESEVPLKPENVKTEEKTVSNSEEKIESISLPTQDLGDGKEGTEKQLAETGAPSGEPVHIETASVDNENSFNEEVPAQQFLGDVETKVSNDNLKAPEVPAQQFLGDAETKVSNDNLNAETKVSNDNLKAPEVPAQQFLSDAETKVSNDNLKAPEDGSRPTTNYSIHHEDKRPHEPKASPVSC